ncbi:S phase cyclin A-associated protein in the endoplasmic reticulum-like isoform X1 [Biomphalaria glabrata]|uniref:S phase cyclin A-associated protein in the endoplasmic reticulum-like isoform X2 n=1 Tax=Biomphalaria glabrata TaxID=6526 RepID=A0A9U8E5A3_BIOGL|nr:S phase cyclin A-associated protein in the endoplasmic reticulum-like isoform X2 [Biomphalaria glabrata]KAI8768922.1 S phase cyclin A-associated protein in the endoplasmic reticulum-like isoform X1 [Biomphalaria glabrata]
MSDSKKKRGSAWSTKSRQDREKGFGYGNESNNWKSQRTSQYQRPKSAYYGQQNQQNHKGSYDNVRNIVQEEGRTARNLVQYNVPVSENPQLEQLNVAVNTSSSYQQKRTSSSSRTQPRRTPPPGSRFRHRSLSDMTKSPRSETGSKKNDLRARYWKYMFDNFQRAVDSIYQTCEQDESIVECKEVIMMLERSTKDFKALIETLLMMKAYEDSAKEGDRPSAVAWEVRKMSPNKHAPSSPAPPVPPAPILHSEKSGNSWADKVKGVRAITFSNVSVCEVDTVNNMSSLAAKQAETVLIESSEIAMAESSETTLIEQSDTKLKETSPTEESSDEGGWETVQRGRLRARQSPLQKSTESLAQNVKSARRNLMRSMSVPDQGNNIVNQETSKAQAKTLRAISERHLPATEPQQRERACSKDSEKENIPECLGESVNSISSSANSPSDSSSTATNSSSTAPAKSLDISQVISVDKVLKESLELDLDTDIDLVLDEELQLSRELEKAQESALAYAVQEEENWLKELAREQSSQVDVDLEEAIDLGNTNSSLESTNSTITDWDSLVAVHEAEMKQGSMLSWGDLVEAEEARMPGHGVHMHEKLSSPSRKRSPTESRRRHEEKQAKAQELRGKLMQEKAERLRDLSKKVEEVRAYKEELMRQSKTLLEHKLQRAEEKRQLQLKLKARKAHEEEAKANEIAFINTLEAQNKRHYIMSKHQESEARLHDLMEERMRKLEEKQAKEAAVEERRKALEADRKARLQEMQEKRKLRDARIEQQQLEKEKERLEAARARGKEREERIAALNAMQEAHKQVLQKKIQQKQDETTQRHEEHLQQIRGRAFEMSIMKHSTEDHNDAPQLTPYDKNKLCSICNVLIPSEVYLLSHLHGKKHQQALKDNNSGKEMTKQEIETFNLKHIVDAPDNSNHPKIVTEKERQKSLKKRCKKLRQRMITRGLEYESFLANKLQSAESEHKAKLHKIIKDMNKYIQSQDTGPWPHNKVAALDRALGETGRIMEKKGINDQTSFRVLGGFNSLSRILMTIDATHLNVPCVIPSKSLAHATDVYRLACKNNFDNCHYLLFSNKLGLLVDHLMNRLNALLPEDFGRPSSAVSGSVSSHTSDSSGGDSLPFDPVCSGLMQILSTVLSCLAKNNPSSNCSEASSERMSGTGDAFANRGNDLISYIISVGVMDKLRNYCSAVRGPVDGDKNSADFLLHSLGLLVAMTKFMSKRNANVFEKKRPEDPTQLISTFEVTELVGIVSLLYGMLLHSGAPSRSLDNLPRELAPQTVSIILAGLRMLNHLAVLDLQMLQSTLGEEGLSLEFRHIVSYLIWYCSHVTSEELLHEVVLCVGYFTVLHPDNQVIIQSGQPPTVLQQLCSLPFQYFSDPRLVAVLLPSLICCCYNNNSNRDILEQELSCALLANFVEERQLEFHQLKLMPSSVKKSKNQDNKEIRETENRMTFAMRFPIELWDSAQAYFIVV